MASNCSKCMKRINKRNNDVFVKCNKCSFDFCGACAVITKTELDFLIEGGKQWACVNCDKVEKSFRYEDDGTHEVEHIGRVFALLNTLSNKFDTQHKLLNETIARFENRFIQLESVLKSKIEAMEHENKILKNSIDELKTRSYNIDKFMQTNCDLEQKIDFLEQKLLKTSIEVVNVPNMNEHSTTDTILHILKTGLDINIGSSSILNCYRKKSKTAKPGVIVVEFNNVYVKNSVISAKIKRRSFLNTNLFSVDNNSNNNGNNKPTAIFINECLSTEKRKLFNAAKVIKEEKKYKFLWSKNGNIMMKKDKEDEHLVHTIRSAEDLKKIA